jgi:hypothetical protein
MKMNREDVRHWNRIYHLRRYEIGAADIKGKNTRLPIHFYKENPLIIILG